jgi:hypothetical protein
MAAFKGHLGHNYHVLIINIRSFSHLLMPVPFEKGTSTPQARNGWDMQSENDPHLDRSTLKDLWQPFRSSFGSYYHVLLIINLPIFASSHASAFLKKAQAQAQNARDGQEIAL